MIAAATEDGFRLTDGQLVRGRRVRLGRRGKSTRAGGRFGAAGHNGRDKVDRYLRVLDHPEIYVAGDLASVTDPRTGHVLGQGAERAKRWPAT